MKLNTNKALCGLPVALLPKLHSGELRVPTPMFQQAGMPASKLLVKENRF